MTSSILILTVFILLLSIHQIFGSNNGVQFDNFTIEWIEFNILNCAVPTTVNISLFSCIEPNYTQTDDRTCLEPMVTEFDRSTCQPTSTVTPPTARSEASVTNRYLSTTDQTIAIATKTTGASALSSPAKLVSDANQSAVSMTDVSVTSMSIAISLITQSTPTSKDANTPLPLIPATVDVTAQSFIVETAIGNTMPTEIIQETTVTVSTITPYVPVNMVDTTNTASDSALSSTEQTDTSVVKPSLFYCRGDVIGSSCNISSDPCAMAQPCLNAATCYPNKTLPLGYQCHCQPGYTGGDCEKDERICNENTCRNHGECLEINSTVSGKDGTTFYCECEYGYTGTRCELRIDFCRNITCANRGICQTINMTWKCICLSSSFFYGDYCQFQTSSLTVRKVMSRSFASVAITAIVFTCSFIVLMDILKYVFRIDPVKEQREKYRKEQEQEKQAAKSDSPKVAVRFQYVP